jgi:hypothetical protein
MGLVLLLGGTAHAQQGTLRTALSPLPIWPADGVIPQALRDRYAFLDPSAGQIVLAYPENLGRPQFARSPGARHVERVDLNNQVKASVASIVSLEGAQFVYRYRIANAKQAKRPVTRFDVEGIVLNGSDLISSPASWKSNASVKSGIARPTLLNAVSTVAAGSGGPSMYWRVGDAGIEPGAELDGFQVASSLKPGLIMAHLRAGEPPTLRTDLPRAVLAQAAPMLQPTHNSQTVFAIGPRYSAETPTLQIVADFHFAISRLVRHGQLDASSPAIREALQVLGQYLKSAAEQPHDTPVESWVGPPLIFTATPQRGLEADLLNAMQLSLN